MSEPKTSLPLHCISSAAFLDSSFGHLMSYLVVNPEGEFLVGIRHLCGIPETVDRQATCGRLEIVNLSRKRQPEHTDGWHEDLDITAGNQLGLRQRNPISGTNECLDLTSG